MSRRRPQVGPLRGFRLDIQALRAFAVSAVVVNHVWPGLMPGGFIGVDIFFVVSGFLISGHLVEEVRRTGRVRLSAFWMRRARRLLPAALLVLLVSLLGTVVLIPQTAWRSVMQQIAGSAAYVQNWTLAAQSSNYFTSADSPSPVTHFWSLSVEEQFYLFWPLLLLGVAALCHRRKRAETEGSLALLPAVVALVTLASFGYAVWAAAGSSSAYFSTLARVWQFGVGALIAWLAAGLARQRLTPRGIAVARRLGVAGWAGLFASLWLVSPQDELPGWSVLLPVLSAGLVIGAGAHPAVSHPPVVAARPVQVLADLSYSVYLWHWPLIILLGHALGTSTLGFGWRLLILPVTLALAWVTTVFVENPVRFSPRVAKASVRRTALVAATAMAAVLALTTVATHRVDAKLSVAAAAMQQASTDPCFGAGALAPGASCPRPFELTVSDSALLVGQTRSRMPAGGACGPGLWGSEVESCAFGADAADAELTVALAGDSHAAHYAAGIGELVEQEDWRLQTYVKASCPLVVSDSIRAQWDPRPAKACQLWGTAAVSRIAADPNIDLVVVSSASRGYSEDHQLGDAAALRTADAYVRAWQRLSAAGKKVLVIGDVPDLKVGDVPTCLEQHDGYDPCATPQAVAQPEDPLVVAVRQLDDPNVQLFDPTPFICAEGTCHAVVGGIPVYADINHLSGPFAATLAPYLLPAIRKVLG